MLHVLRFYELPQSENLHTEIVTKTCMQINMKTQFPPATMQCEQVMNRPSPSYHFSPIRYRCQRNTGKVAAVATKARSITEIRRPS